MARESGTDADFLNGQYYIQSELGSGGFGKVKLGIHVVTGEQVAIKIIDKKAIGEDLIRVRTELEVLKTLAHQNICRMYQYHETEHKVYIVMEYCNGGEMFDYIVRKDRLDEPEARFFFRQLLQAMAYTHSLGICHRDLKPENLMLNSDLKLKVIDFGLSAQPKKGLVSSLQTCCGSPAYAAPEIIEHSAYYGHEVDIWSMGVLLYVLLCGVLPFEDESLPRLYKKIKGGFYYEPDYLSPLSKDILRSMLHVNPRHRISMKNLLNHKWTTRSYGTVVKYNSIYDKNVIDSEVALELAFNYGMPTPRMVNVLKQWKYDYTTATYLILLRRKENKLDYRMPMCRHSTNISGVLHSPTIHKSLESDLDRLELEDMDRKCNGTDTVSDTSTGAIACGSPASKAMYQQPRTRIDQEATPVLSARHKARMAKDVAFVDNKENYASLRVRGANPERKVDSIYGTPRRPGIPKLGAQHPPRPRAHSVERSSDPYASPSTPNANDSSGREQTTPTSTRRPRIKSSKLPRRVFSSLERSGAKLKNLLTPKKVSQNRDAPASLTFQAGTNFANLSVTSSNDCGKVREELVRVLLAQNISVTADKWTISGKKSTPGMPDTVVELEIVWLETLRLVGVRRRRLTGDALNYKKICEQVLALAGL